MVWGALGSSGSGTGSFGVAAMGFWLYKDTSVGETGVLTTCVGLTTVDLTVCGDGLAGDVRISDKASDNESGSLLATLAVMAQW